MSTGLYIDPDTGANISTNSMLKTFRRCPRQADYKYARRLKPKTHSVPLTRGKWMHSLLEAYYKHKMPGYDGPTWQDEHKRLSNDFSKLFDEEKEKLGDLPRECDTLMRGYLWHYKNDDAWTVLEVEGMIEVPFPDGTIFRGKFDVMVEDDYGIWIVDHKNMKTFPSHLLRVLDTQSGMYVWAARQKGINVQGFIWNYLRTKAPTPPVPLKDGSRLSKTSLKNCDYLSAYRALKQCKDDGMDIKPYMTWLRGLKEQRYEYGAPQTSDFFYRNVLERDDDMLNRIATEFFHTSMRMHDYDFSVEARDTIERVVDRSCDFMCSYGDICAAELIGGNTDIILRKNYREADPMEYYYDERELEKSEG